MKSFEYVIKDEVGIHARPAGMLVNEAKKYKSDIKINIDGRSAQATKLMALMGLGVRKGMTVTVIAEGEDEDIATKEMERFFNENL